MSWRNKLKKAAILGGGAFVGGPIGLMAASQYLGGEEKRKAEQASADQSRADFQQAAEEGKGYLTDAYGTAKDSISQYSQLAQDALRSGNTQAANSYRQMAEQARGELNQGYGQARTDLSGGYSSARSALDPLTALSHYGEDALTGKGFTESGGYQFRLNQGQEALDRKQSAMGGRASGAAMKAMADYNQGAASQEYGDWASRAMELGKTGYGAVGRVSDLYGAEGQDLAGMSERRGAGLSRISENEGGYLGNLESATGTGISNLLGQQGTSYADLASNYGSNMANIGSNLATNTNQLNFAGNQYAGGLYDALSSGINSGMSLASFAASGGLSGLSNNFSNLAKRSGSGVTGQGGGYA